LEANGRRILFRCAAQIVAARLGLTPKPLLDSSTLTLPEIRHGGLIVVGSYVRKTTEQLSRLRAAHPLKLVEVDVAAVLNPATADAAIARCINETNAALAAKEDTLVFTSRELVRGDSAETSLGLGEMVSSALIAIIQGLSVRPRFL